MTPDTSDPSAIRNSWDDPEFTEVRFGVDLPQGMTVLIGDLSSVDWSARGVAADAPTSSDEDALRCDCRGGAHGGYTCEGCR